MQPDPAPARHGPATAAIAVTGTDTGVGKTVVACALAAAARDEGRQVRAFKPVETGVEAGGAPRDAERLRWAASSPQSIDEICPVTLEAPLAPMVAARLAGVTIDVDRLDVAFEAARRAADLTIVEGAGGLLVPIDSSTSFATLVARWDLPLVIVAVDKLGVINHVLLTIEAAEQRGIRVAGVVLVEPPGTADPSTRTNRRTLHDLTGLPVLAFPRLRSVEDISGLAAAARASGILDLVAAPAPLLS